MKNQRLSAAKLLQRILDQGRPSAGLLGLRPAGRPDHAAHACAVYVYGVLQHKNLLDYISRRLSTFQPKLPPVAANVLRVSLYSLLFQETPMYAVAAEAAKALARYGKYKKYVHKLLLLAAEQGPAIRAELLQRGTDPAALSVRYSLPIWLVKQLGRQFAGRRQDILDAYQQRPNLYIRFPAANLPPSHGLLQTTSLPEVFQVRGRRLPELLAALRETGLPWYIQSLSSACLSRLMPACPNMRILDLTTGKGGKLLHLADLYGNQADYTAFCHDASDKPFLLQNMRQWHMETAIRVTSDPAALAEASYTHVLVDAPCSGSGIIGKYPEIRFRITREALSHMQALQGRLLARAAKLAAPGGYVLYSTCSILAQENEHWLQHTPAGMTLEQPLRQGVPPEYFMQGMFRALPCYGVDGMTALLWRRGD